MMRRKMLGRLGVRDSVSVSAFDVCRLSLDIVSDMLSVLTIGLFCSCADSGCATMNNRAKATISLVNFIIIWVWFAYKDTLLVKINKKKSIFINFYQNYYCVT